jgi:hypothetical protein
MPSGQISIAIVLAGAQLQQHKGTARPVISGTGGGFSG